MNEFFERPAWQQRAACRGMDVNMFYPQDSHGRAAKAVCASCPVREECLEEAVDRGEIGCWGGVIFTYRDSGSSPRRRNRKRLAGAA